jgi:hypothetical protein
MTGAPVGLVAKMLMSFCLGAGSLVWSDHIAAHYAPGYFARVAARRQLPSAPCYVASPSHDIGSWLLVEGVRTGVQRLCLVADTSQPWDRARHLRARLIELDYDSARAICGSTRLPNRDCPVRVRKPLSWPTPNKTMPVARGSIH